MNQLLEQLHKERTERKNKPGSKRSAETISNSLSRRGDELTKEAQNQESRKTKQAPKRTADALSSSSSGTTSGRQKLNVVKDSIEITNLVDDDDDDVIEVKSKPAKKRQRTQEADVLIFDAKGHLLNVSDLVRHLISDKHDQASLTSLKICTWNIAECKSSFSAPRTWSDSTNEAEIKKIIMLGSYDVINLQECPRADFEINKDLYTRSYSRKSHCGFVITYVHKKHTPLIHYVALDSLPAVGMVMKVTNTHYLTVVNVHLAPGSAKDSSKQRIEQTDKIRQKIDSIIDPACNDLLLAGDCNARNKEIKDMERKTRCSIINLKENQNSWDSFRNHYHEKGFQYRCNFDRIFFGDAKSALKVCDLGLIGDQPASSDSHHYLSDHFGIRMNISAT